MKTPVLHQAQGFHYKERDEKIDGVDVRKQCGKRTEKECEGPEGETAPLSRTLPAHQHQPAPAENQTVRARLVRVGIRESKDGKEGSYAAVERAKPPAHEDKDAGAKGPESHHGRQPGCDEAFTAEMLAPSGEEIKEGRVEVRSM